MISFVLMKIGALGEFVARRRKALGVTQSELAEISQVSLHTLSNIESGNGNPTLGNLYRVAAALGLNVELTVNKI